MLQRYLVSHAGAKTANNANRYPTTGVVSSTVPDGAYDAEKDRAIVITAYQPDMVKWIDFKKQRNP